MNTVIHSGSDLPTTPAQQGPFIDKAKRAEMRAHAAETIRAFEAYQAGTMQPLREQLAAA